MVMRLHILKNEQIDNSLNKILKIFCTLIPIEETKITKV